MEGGLDDIGMFQPSQVHGVKRIKHVVSDRELVHCRPKRFVPNLDLAGLAKSSLKTPELQVRSRQNDWQNHTKTNQARQKTCRRVSRETSVYPQVEEKVSACEMQQ